MNGDLMACKGTERKKNLDIKRPTGKENFGSVNCKFKTDGFIIS